MNIDTVKLELIEWITQLSDQQSIKKLLMVKNKLSRSKGQSASKIYGSGKHLIDYVAEDFNESTPTCRTV